MELMIYCSSTARNYLGHRLIYFRMRKTYYHHITQLQANGI